MKNKNKYLNYVIAITFTWSGFVSAISFMEAWLKFQAPGITLELGLGIGQLVFTALNRVEVVCALFLLVGMVLSGFIKSKISVWTFFLIPLGVLTLQTLWLLPALSERASLIIQGVTVPESRLHLWFVILEALKVISLWAFGFQLLNTKK